MSDPWKRMEQIGDCTLYLGDCREVIPTLSPHALLLTDPPYGLGELWNGGGGKSKSSWLFKSEEAKGWDAATIPDAIEAAVKLCSTSIIWGGNYYVLPPSRGWLIWDKIVRNFSTGVAELAWTNIDQPIKAFNYAHGQLASEGKLHPTQKPLPLIGWCMEFAPHAMSVLDPFMGSGTTGVACVKSGRAFTGIELDESYFQIACERIRKAYAQPDMFVEALKPPEQVGMEF